MTKTLTKQLVQVAIKVSTSLLEGNTETQEVLSQPAKYAGIFATTMFDILFHPGVYPTTIDTDLAILRRQEKEHEAKLEGYKKSPHKLIALILQKCSQFGSRNWRMRSWNLSTWDTCWASIDIHQQNDQSLPSGISKMSKFWQNNWYLRREFYLW